MNETLYLFIWYVKIPQNNAHSHQREIVYKYKEHTHTHILWNSTDKLLTIIMLVAYHCGWWWQQWGKDSGSSERTVESGNHTLTCPATFLVQVLHGLAQCVVDDKANVRLVNSHAKRHSCHNNLPKQYMAMYTCFITLLTQILHTLSES